MASSRIIQCSEVHLTPFDTISYAPYCSVVENRKNNSPNGILWAYHFLGPVTGDVRIPRVNGTARARVDIDDLGVSFSRQKE
eukprot:scaffold675052_cov63-Attheya_sp.AAC.2